MTSNLVDWLCQACRANKLALISHANPDGDTVGATLALRLAFLRLGKAVDVICDGEIPARLGFLEGHDAYILPQQAATDYDAAIAVDVASPELMRGAASVFDAAPVKLVIDHHPTNPCFGDYNLLYAGECISSMPIRPRQLSARQRSCWKPALMFLISARDYIACKKETG